MTLTLGYTKSHQVPSTSCEVCTGKIWSCYFQKFMRRCIYKKIHYLTFDLDHGVKFTQNVTQYPLHHVIFASTSCDLCICKVWSCYVKRFWRRYNYKKRDGRTDRQTDTRRTDFGTKLIYPIFLTIEFMQRKFSSNSCNCDILKESEIMMG